MSEKVRKKQESIVLLQEEKEHLYTDNMRLQEEIKHMAADKQRELADQKETLGASVEEKMREIDSLKLFSNSRIKELEDIISSLNREVRSCMVTKSEVTNSLIRNACLKPILVDALNNSAEYFSPVDDLVTDTNSSSCFLLKKCVVPALR